MKKVILTSILGIGITLCGVVFTGQSTIAQDNCGECSTSNKWPTIVTCFIISGKYSDSDTYVLIGTGDKKKCKNLQDASCPYDWQSGCLSNYSSENQSIE
jgi:hypothetical protein